MAANSMGPGALALLVAGALTCASPSLSAADRFDPVRMRVRQMLVKDSVASISVAVARDGKIVWEEGFGWANREDRVPATEHTVYSLASVSKPLTATGLMTLVESGRIDLDRPVNDYLGDAKLRARVGDARDATVRRVANHTSGLPTHRQFFFANEPYRAPSMDETILRYGNLVRAPGEHLQYSNLGFGVLDYVISRVSGETYADFMRQQVFIPLGLTHTSVGVAPGLERYEAVRYDETGARIPFYDFDHRGASAIYSSAHDLVRFGMFHLRDSLADQRPILTAASLDSMHRRTSTIPGTDGRKGYGVGWGVVDRPDGYHVISHTGGMPGVATAIMLVPDQHIAAVVLSNSGREHGRDPTSPIVESIMKTLLTKWRTSPPDAGVAELPFRATANWLGTWEGTLHTDSTDLPLKLECLPSGDIHIRVGDSVTTLLNRPHLDDGWLHGETLGDVRTEESRRHPVYSLSVSLKPNGDVMSGTIDAIGNYFSLSYWAELRRRP